MTKLSLSNNQQFAYLAQRAKLINQVFIFFGDVIRDLLPQL
jgi:hypothetical protein